jgi:hypothetical protein
LTFCQVPRLFYQRAYFDYGGKNVAKQFYDEQKTSLDEESRNRLWDHGKHAECVFLNQLTFFLIFESLLLGSVINGILVNQHLYGRTVLLGITILGCLVTLFWLCIQYSQGHLFERLKIRIEEQLPEYKETLRQRREEVGRMYQFAQLMNSLTFQAISIPGLVAIAWFGLLLSLLI